MSQITERNVIDQDLQELITAFDRDAAGDRIGVRYPVKKLDAHQRDIPHLAISIFLFSGDRLLIQKRAPTKYHSGDLWANTVCSHPRWQESESACASRRLFEELGLTIPVQQFGEIEYQAQVGALFENEHVYCFHGQFDERQDIGKFNRREVSEVRWLTLSEIDKLIERHPEQFTEWFKIYMCRYRDMIDELNLADRAGCSSPVTA
ncbi:MAG: NUDIX domain-containing protein [Granulosicoccus sp.]|nr:NUDIX domain-containing protein [Granulosicoccus sp.]